MLSESLRGVLAQRLIRRADGRGRQLALEILVSGGAVASLIRERKTFQLATVIQTGKKEGMQSMDESVLNLLKAGIVSVEEAVGHLSSRDLIPAGLGTPAPAVARPPAAA
jgi:twitching motility protein PilT